LRADEREVFGRQREVSAVMSKRTREAAELIERGLAMKGSHLVDTLSKSRHLPHAILHVPSTESTGHLALRVQ
jgi:hypothetical protein